jgi:hypothetical protein
LIETEIGEHWTDTALIAVEEETVTVVLPDFEPSCSDLAMMDAVPSAVGVKTPLLVIDPALTGDTDHNTDGSYFPVPLKAAAHVDTCPAVTVEGEHVTATEAMEGCAGAVVTVTPQDEQEKAIERSARPSGMRPPNLNLAILE